MAARGKGPSQSNNHVQGLKAPPRDNTNQQDLMSQLMEAANKAVMNRDYDSDVPAPTELDQKQGVDLKVSQKDQREHGVLSRRAFNVAGQVYIQDTVMTPKGDMGTQWKLAKKRLYQSP